MAGSRRDKLGSIFSRLTGLLRSGAIKEEDRPIWYDVVKAFPPQPKPPPKQTVPNIFYPEDFVRVHFYNTYSEPGATRLTNERMRSVQQRFVDQYLVLNEQKSVPPDQMFEETARLLKEQGIKLITHEERQAAEKLRVKERGRQPQITSDDPFFANTSTISAAASPRTAPSPKKPTEESAAPSKVDIDSLFEDPR